MTHPLFRFLRALDRAGPVVQLHFVLWGFLRFRSPLESRLSTSCFVSRSIAAKTFRMFIS